MIAAKLRGIVTQDHQLEIKLPHSIPPGEVEIIILYPGPLEKVQHQAHKLDPNVHPAAGIWADREDIGDTVEFTAKLRRRLETRADARG